MMDEDILSLNLPKHGWSICLKDAFDQFIIRDFISFMDKIGCPCPDELKYIFQNVIESSWTSISESYEKSACLRIFLDKTYDYILKLAQEQNLIVLSESLTTQVIVFSTENTSNWLPFLEDQWIETKLEEFVEDVNNFAKAMNLTHLVNYEILAEFLNHSDESNEIYQENAEKTLFLDPEDAEMEMVERKAIQALHEESMIFQAANLNCDKPLKAILAFNPEETNFNKFVSYNQKEYVELIKILGILDENDEKEIHSKIIKRIKQNKFEELRLNFELAKNNLDEIEKWKKRLEKILKFPVKVEKAKDYKMKGNLKNRSVVQINELLGNPENKTVRARIRTLELKELKIHNSKWKTQFEQKIQLRETSIFDA